ncbi:hypothetical protein V8D89_000061 [Ganoderma adspersum]
MKDGWDAKSHIHAEAAIMALACEAQSPPEGRRRNIVDQLLGPGKEAPIGINMNGCPLCFLIGELLNNRQDVDYQFILPDVTHELVFPWDPPPFGIPQSILIQIRDRLLRKIVDLSVQPEGRQPRGRLSRRTWSPVSGTVTDRKVRFANFF